MYRFHRTKNCQVVVAQSKCSKEPGKRNVCWKNYRCHLGMLRALDFQAETVLFPPEYIHIRPSQGHDFLSWINLTFTACSLSSLGFHWLIISPVMERTPPPGRTKLVPILNYITNTHLVIKLPWVFQWEDVGGNTPGSGVEIFRFPREISHILIPSSPFTVIYLGARRTKRVNNKVPQPSTPQHVLWGSQEEFSSFALGQTGCPLTAVSSHRQIRPRICLHRWGL